MHKYYNKTFIINICNNYKDGPIFSGKLSKNDLNQHLSYLYKDLIIFRNWLSVGKECSSIVEKLYEEINNENTQ